MKKTITLALILGILGLIIGYLIFAKVGDSYIAIRHLIGGGNNFLEKLGNEIRGVDEIRSKIILTGAGGIILGIVLGFSRKK